MASQDRGRPLPKFGEWDVNNPASAEGFTVIFNKARDEKKTTGTAANMPQQINEPVFKNESFPQYTPPPKKKVVLLWLKPQWFQKILNSCNLSRKPVRFAPPAKDGKI